jgi:LCP family protein required for cell wall assembly
MAILFRLVAYVCWPAMANAPRSTLATFFGRYLISLAVATVLMVGGVVAVNHGIDDRVAKIHRIKLTVAPEPPGGSNFLIIGSDTRAFVNNPTQESAFGDPSRETGQRSDTLMVAHVEPGSQHSFVVSFPRDLMVDIPGLSGKNRINMAYSEGGPNLVIQTLQANFGIEINHYLEVDFQSFAAVVDAIGKVNVYIPGQLRDEESGFRTLFGAGCYALSGTPALAYVRARTMEIADPDGPIVDKNGTRWRLLDVRADLDRIQRQQFFIRELASVAISRSLGDPFLASEVADRVLHYLTADQNLSRGDVNALIRAFRTVNVNDSNSVRFETLPTNPDPNNPGVTLVPDEDLDAPVIAALRTFGDNTPKPPTVAPAQVEVEVRDGTGTGIADATSSALVAQGFVGIGTAPGPANLKVTEIRYGPDSADAAKTLLDYVPDAALRPDASLKGSNRVVLVLGHSFQAITVPPPPTTTLAPAPGVPVTTTTAPATSTSTTRPPNQCPN